MKPIQPLYMFSSQLRYIYRSSNDVADMGRQVTKIVFLRCSNRGCWSNGTPRGHHRPSFQSGRGAVLASLVHIHLLRPTLDAAKSFVSSIHEYIFILGEMSLAKRAHVEKVGGGGS
jgi:hypothetical protein